MLLLALPFPKNVYEISTTGRELTGSFDTQLAESSQRSYDVDPVTIPLFSDEEIETRRDSSLTQSYAAIKMPN